MRALIIDDERLARKELIKLLNEHPEIEVIGEAMNADEAMDLIEKMNPDLLFLDIQMPGKSGFELLEMLDTVPMVIFTTAFDEYALKAFEVSALDYLLKPIQPDRLNETITKLIKLESGQSGESSTENEGARLKLNDRVFVKDGLVRNCGFA